MKASEVKVGTLLIRNYDKTWVIYKISETEVVILRSPWGHEIGSKMNVNYFGDRYVECSTKELSEEEMAIYNSQVVSLLGSTKISKGCTCEITTLMATGCTCGWIAMERKQ